MCKSPSPHQNYPWLETPPFACGLPIFQPPLTGDFPALSIHQIHSLFMNYDHLQYLEGSRISNHQPTIHQPYPHSFQSEINKKHKKKKKTSNFMVKSHENPITSWLPSGNLWHSYWKWPSRNSGFSLINSMVDLSSSQTVSHYQRI